MMILLIKKLKRTQTVCRDSASKAWPSRQTEKHGQPTEDSLSLTYKQLRQSFTAKYASAFHNRREYTWNFSFIFNKRARERVVVI